MDEEMKDEVVKGVAMEDEMIDYSSEEHEKPLLTETEIKNFYALLKTFFEKYKAKADDMDDKEWMSHMFQMTISEISEEQAKLEVDELFHSISSYEENLKSLTCALENGVSREEWLTDIILKIMRKDNADQVVEGELDFLEVGEYHNSDFESPTQSYLKSAVSGYSTVEFTKALQGIDDKLYSLNQDYQISLRRSKDGAFMQSPNLDGNIAEHFHTQSFNMNAFLKGSNVRAHVRNSHALNSTDIRVIDPDIGKYHNYQSKYGKDVKASIDLLEHGDYRNQRVLIPEEQKEAISEHFLKKGSKKTVGDTLDSFGVTSTPLSKVRAKEIQQELQEKGNFQGLRYQDLNTLDLATHIGKNSIKTGIYSMAGWGMIDLFSRLADDREIEAEEILENAISTGIDSTSKTIVAGAYHVAIRKGTFGALATNIPTQFIGGMACATIDSLKTMMKIAEGELTMLEGVDEMFNHTSSALGGFASAGSGAALGAALTAWMPVVGAPLAAVTGAIGGMLSFMAGSEIGKAVYQTTKSVITNFGDIVSDIADGAREFVGVVWESAKSVVSSIGDGICSLVGGFFSLFDF